MKKQPTRADMRLDTLGLLCPLPIVKTSEAIKNMRVGEVLAVLSDDTGILVDMPAWCRGTGHTLVCVEDEGTMIVAYVRKETAMRSGKSGGVDFPSDRA